jgi:Ni,Fe-hydrogenase III large subunit
MPLTDTVAPTDVLAVMTSVARGTYCPYALLAARNDGVCGYELVWAIVIVIEPLAKVGAGEKAKYVFVEVELERVSAP